MNEVSLERAESGVLRVSGVLTFYSVPVLVAQGANAFAGEAQALQFDLAGVSRSDSAGIALLLEWTRLARARNTPITFINVPAQMRALARVSGVDALISW